MLLDKLTGWLLDLVKAVFTALWDFLGDLLVWAFNAVLQAVAAVIAAIPVPDFVAGGMQAVLGGLPGAILYCLVGAGLPSALAMIGTAFAFRMARKAATLFQW